MTDGTTRSGAFESASELRREHQLLLERLDELLAADAGEDLEGRAIARLADEIRRFLERGAATGAYLEEVRQRTSCQVLLDFWVSGLARAGLPAPRVRLAGFDPTQLPELRDEDCPYVGLEAFRDAAFFFGRRDDTARLVEQIRQAPLVVVLGASGSGKSSLVLGGAIPALAGSPEGFRFAPPVVPGDTAVERLAAALRTLDGGAPEASAADLDAVIGGLGPPPAIVVIDQFEEVFTLNRPEERERMTAYLADLLAASAGHKVVLTLREEFRSRLVELTALQRYLQDPKLYSYTMEPMNFDQLREAVLGPAAEVNLQFQSGIADELARDVLGQPAALPLLQFTLRELWERRDRNRITREVYDRVGRPVKALQNAADAFYDDLAPETQAEVKRILLELVRVDELLEAYRQPVPRTRLLEAGKANTDEVLELLAANDYIRVTPGELDRDAVVEVKHEALIRNWPTYVGWIDEKRRREKQRLLLSEAAQRWHKHRDDEHLLTGWALEEAKKLPDLSPVERDFLDASVEALERVRREREDAERRRRELIEDARREREKAERRRRFVIGLAAVLALLGLLYVEAQRARREASLARDEAVAAKERADEARGQLQVALERETEARDAAERAEDEARQLAFETRIAEWEAEQERRTAVDAGLKLKAALESETLALAERQKALERAEEAFAKEEEARKAADEAKAAAVEAKDEALKARADEKKARLRSVARQVAGQAVQLEPILDQDRALAAMLALQAHRALVESAGDPLDPTAFRALWKSFTWLGEKWDTTLELDTEVRAVAAGPGAGLFAVGTAAGRVYLFEDWKSVVDKRVELDSMFGSDLVKDRLFRAFLNDRSPISFAAAEVRSLAFSASGRRLAAGSSAGEVRILDLEGTASRKRARAREAPFGTVREIERPSESQSVEAVAFSPDGSLLATAGPKVDLRLWRTVDRTAVAAPGAAGILARSLAFSPDGTRLAAGTSEGVRILSRSGAAGPWAVAGPPAGKDCDVQSLLFPDPSTIVSGCRREGRMLILELEAGSPPRSTDRRGHDSPVTSLSYRAGRLATASLDGTVRLWSDLAAAGGSELPIVFDDHESWVWSVDFHPENGRPDGALLSAGADRTVRRFFTHSRDLVGAICDRLEGIEELEQSEQWARRRPAGELLSPRQWDEFFRAVEQLRPPENPEQPQQEGEPWKVCTESAAGR